MAFPLTTRLESSCVFHRYLRPGCRLDRLRLHEERFHEQPTGAFFKARFFVMATKNKKRTSWVFVKIFLNVGSVFNRTLVNDKNEA